MQPYIFISDMNTHLRYRVRKEFKVQIPHAEISERGDKILEFVSEHETPRFVRRVARVCVFR